MRSVIVLFLTFLISTFSHCQGKWKRGTIVTQKLDTLKGYIRYKDFNFWKEETQVVKYRPSLRSKDWVTYNVKDLKFFGYDSSVPASLEYIYQYEEVRGKRVLNEKRTDSINKISVWMDVLVQGEQVSLLTWNKIFYLKMHDSVTQLTYYNDYTNFGESIQNWEYINTLRDYARRLGFNWGLDFEISTCAYNTDELTDMVIHMNKGNATVCYDQTPQFYTTSFFGGVGISTAKIFYDDYSMSAGTPSQSGLPFYSGIPLQFGTPILMNFNAGMDLGVTSLPLTLRLEGSYTSGKMDAKSPAGSNQNFVYKHNPKTISCTVSLMWDIIERKRYKVWLGLGAMDTYLNNKVNTVYDLNSNKTFNKFLAFDGTAHYFVYRVGLLINRRWEVSATVCSKEQLSWGTYHFTTRPYFLSLNYHLPTIKSAELFKYHPVNPRK